MWNLTEFYYFSGTGNTKVIVEMVLSLLEKQGIKVNVHKIEEGFIQPRDRDVKIGFAFPANSQAVSPAVWRFFKKLPRGNGEKVFLMATMNQSAYIIDPLIKLLKKKGYIPESACEISMPNNMIDTRFDEAEDQNRIEESFNKVKLFINDLISGKTSLKTMNRGSAFVSLLSRKTALPWFFMRLMFKLDVDRELCSNCGLCISSCPAGNIQYKEYPVHRKKCEFCMRCAAYCPQKAVYVKGKKNIVIRSAKI